VCRETGRFRWGAVSRGRGRPAAQLLRRSKKTRVVFRQFTVGVTDYARYRPRETLDNLKIITEALTLVNTRFRAMSSLQEIIVEVYEDGPSAYLRRQIESHGWTISATEHVEEWGPDKVFDDFKDD
jgi:hypothetical protein